VPSNFKRLKASLALDPTLGVSGSDSLQLIARTKGHNPSYLVGNMSLLDRNGSLTGAFFDSKTGWLQSVRNGAAGIRISATGCR
jgi:hypothetical protein